MGRMKGLYTDGVTSLAEVSFAKQVLDDLSEALRVDRERAFEAGRLAERESGFESRQEAYQGGVADERERIRRAFLNESTKIADFFRDGLVSNAELLLNEVIKGEQK